MDSDSEWNAIFLLLHALPRGRKGENEHGFGELKSITINPLPLRPNASGGEADARHLAELPLVRIENFGEGVVRLHRQAASRLVGDAMGRGGIEPRKDAVRDQSTGTHERWIDLGRLAVDRAENVES